MSVEYPEFFARFYDLIYHQVRDETDHDYFLNEIKSVKGRILEVGTGTGRFFKDALDQGADLYGIDVSQPMLDVLKQKISNKNYHRISLQDIINFKFDFQFDLIIAPFRVMMHVLDKKDQVTAINNVYNHLNQDGRFVFDVFNPNLKLLLNGLKDELDFEGEYEPGRMFRRYTSTKSDLVNQITDVIFTFEWEENSGTKTKEWQFPLHFFFRFELEHLIERSFFSQHKIFGDYKGSILDENSKEFVVVCEKT